MKSKVCLLLFTLLLSPVFLQAQTRPGSLKGEILESESGQAAIGTNILILGDSAQVVASGVSDYNGIYHINPVPVGCWKVRYSSIGFKTLDVEDVLISSNCPTVLNAKLEPETVLLQSVVVETRRPLIERGKTTSVVTKKDIRNAPAVMVTAEDIQNMAVRDVTAVSSQAAGVTTDANGNARIRGARDEGTVYFIDGVKVRGNVNIPQAAIVQTEVISGGLPAQYSSDPDQRGVRFQLGQPLTGHSHSSVESTPTPAPVFYDREQYNPIYEIPFRTAIERPLSTFSSDVDVAAYANVRRFLKAGNLPPKDAVRLEEMVNYFSYNYPAPSEDEKFGVLTELRPCPWKDGHQLLRIGIQTEKMEQDELPANNLVFLIDVSGSMSSSDKLPLLKRSLKMLVKQMRDEDRISIVVYASASGLVLEPTSGKDKGDILRALSRLNAGGSTAGGAGIELAYKTAKEHFDKKANNRVILCTDGDFNVGVSDQNGLVKLIEEKRDQGVFLTVLGFGTGNYQDGKMEQLANKGNGNYAYIDDLMEAKKVLVNEMGASLHTVAKDTKFQIEFNPAHVMAYRLIGYENRVLADEDFNDDTKDAGDVGSGHRVTAIYEIMPAGGLVPDTAKSKVDTLRYQRVVQSKTGIGELATLKLRYKEPNADKSQLEVHTISTELGMQEQTDFDFICGVLEMGMLLRKSEFRGNSSYKAALTLAKAGKGDDPYGYRGEFIRLVEMAESLDLEQSVGMR